LTTFSERIASLRELPDTFIKDMILTLKGRDVLNMLARSILALYTLDDKADDLSLRNMLNQTVNIISKFPSIIAYSYQALSHAYKGKTLSIRYPQKELSTAENFLYMIKGSSRYNQTRGRFT